MTVTISAEDTRSIKAIEIAAHAATWLHIREAGTSRVIGYQIPSESQPDVWYVATPASCSCFDFQRRHEACKHVLGVRLHVELERASQPKPRAKRPAKPATAPAPATGGVVLDMIREEDGSVRWERHEHGNGTTTYLPRHEVTRPVADASTYDRIFGGEAS